MAFSILKFRIIVGVGFAFTYLAVIFVIVGLTTNYWLEIRDRNINKDDVEIHFGLHRVCWTKSDRCNNPSGNYDKQNFLPVVQGLVISGAILGLAATIAALVNFYREMLELRLKISTIAATALSFLSGMMLIIGCALFSEKIEISQGYGTMFDRYAYRGYSFGLTTCAGGMMWVGAIMVSLATFCGKSDELDKSMPPFPSGTPTPSFISGKNSTRNLYG